MTLKEVKYLFLIILIFIAACIETDIYLPAFSNMMKFFSISEKDIQSLLSWNFIGICISGPFYGPLSDSYGRKKLLIYALSLFLIGSIITIYAKLFNIMLLGRILQGFGSGGCFTLGMAIIFDTFQKDKAISAINHLNTAIPLIMALAPLLGGYLNNVYGFRSNFIFITILVLSSFLICLFFYKESLPPDKRIPFNKDRLKKDFKRALYCIPFWETVMITSLLFGGYLAFVSGTAVLFVVKMGVDKSIFPYYQVALLSSYVLGSLSCTRFLKILGKNKLKMVAFCLILFSGIILSFISYFFPTNAIYINFTMIFYSFGCSWIMAPYFGESMEMMPDIKGITASLITSFRLFVTAFMINISSKLYNGTIYPLVFIIAFIIFFSFILIFHYEKNLNIGIKNKN